MTAGEPVSGVILELVSNTDVIDPGINIHIELDLGRLSATGLSGDFRGGLNIDVPDTGIKRPMLTKRNIHAHLASKSERIIKIQIRIVYCTVGESTQSLDQLVINIFIEEYGLVHTEPQVWLPALLAAARVPLHHQGRG